jgi:hypothetical protein
MKTVMILPETVAGSLTTRESRKSGHRSPASWSVSKQNQERPVNFRPPGLLLSSLNQETHENVLGDDQCLVRRKDQRRSKQSIHKKRLERLIMRAREVIPDPIIQLL